MLILVKYQRFSTHLTGLKFSKNRSNSMVKVRRSKMLVLTTRKGLASRNIHVKYQNSSFHCSKVICRSETETIDHVLWDCEIVQAFLDVFVVFCINMIHTHKKLYTWILCEKIIGKNLIDLQMKYHIYSMRL